MARIPWMEVLTIIAILVAPFVGIWAYGKIEDRKKAYERKLDIFKTLMATRAVVLSPDHVNALNRIDIEFTAVDEKPIREAWAVYLDHLSDVPKAPNLPPPESNEDVRKQYEDDYRQFQSRMDSWAERGKDRLATLLSEMSKKFGYEFDEVKIRKAAYRPQRHEDIESEQLGLLVRANNVLSGIQPLSMNVDNWPEQTEAQELVLKKLMAAVDDDGYYRVKIIEAEKTPPPDRSEGGAG